MSSSNNLKLKRKRQSTGPSHPSNKRKNTKTRKDPTGNTKRSDGKQSKKNSKQRDPFQLAIGRAIQQLSRNLKKAKNLECSKLARKLRDGKPQDPNDKQPDSLAGTKVGETIDGQTTKRKTPITLGDEVFKDLDEQLNVLKTINLTQLSHIVLSSKLEKSSRHFPSAFVSVVPERITAALNKVNASKANDPNEEPFSTSPSSSLESPKFVPIAFLPTVFSTSTATIELLQLIRLLISGSDASSSSNLTTALDTVLKSFLSASSSSGPTKAFSKQKAINRLLASNVVVAGVKEVVEGVRRIISSWVMAGSEPVGQFFAKRGEDEDGDEDGRRRFGIEEEEEEGEFDDDDDDDNEEESDNQEMTTPSAEAANILAKLQRGSKKKHQRNPPLSQDDDDDDESDSNIEGEGRKEEGGHHRRQKISTFSGEEELPDLDSYDSEEEAEIEEEMKKFGIGAETGGGDDDDNYDVEDEVEDDEDASEEDEFFEGMKKTKPRSNKNKNKNPSLSREHDESLSDSDSNSDIALDPRALKKRKTNTKSAVTGSQSQSKKQSAATSTFLPSLSTGFLSGGWGGGRSDESDWEVEDIDGKGGKAERKNRRGQRARRLIWERKYGKEAKHIVKERRKNGTYDKLSNGKQFKGENKQDHWTQQSSDRRSSNQPNGQSKNHRPNERFSSKTGFHDRNRPDGRENSSRGNPNPRVNNNRNNKGPASDANAVPVVPRAPAPSTKEKTNAPALHPSWEAKKKQKAALEGVSAPKGKKIVFD